MIGDGSATFPVVDVTGWEAVAPEQLGSKRKQWLATPDGPRWWFKVVRAKPTSAGIIRTFGEDWAAKVAPEIGLLLGVAVPEVHLAWRTTPSGRGRARVAGARVPRRGPGVVARNELLQTADPSYDRDRRREVPGYTLQAVWAASTAMAHP